MIFIHSYAQLITESTHTAVLDNHDQINFAVNAQLRTIEVAGNMLYVDGNLIESLDDYREGRISAETCGDRIAEVVDRLNPYFDSIKPEIAVADEEGRILGGNYLEHYFHFPELESYLEDYVSFLKKVGPWEADSPIEDIVRQEAAEYFKGGRSAAEIADIIDNRVQLYLDEQ